MIKYKNFGIIGGDMRQIAMSESILKDENKIKLYGIKSNIPQIANLCCDSIDDVIKDSEYIVLPLPLTYDFKTLNAPLCDIEINLNDEFFEKLRGKTVFCGMHNTLKIKIPQYLTIKDYYQREEFAILNAVPTAESAIQIAMSEFGGIIHSSRCLVIGYGRIGKVLSKILNDLGAEVTVSARKPSDLAWIQVMGYKSTNICTSRESLDYDLIFNTVPSKILDRNNLLKCSYNTIIIDLASKPGGVDFDFAEFLGIKAIQALGLPGRFSPVSAGEIIKKTIYNMIEEEKL